MRTYELRRKQWVPRPLEEVFAFFAKAENLEGLTPPFLRFQITRNPRVMEAGARIDYKLRIHGLPVRWKTIIEKWDPPHAFIDVQSKGPYKLWHHTHRFWPENGGTALEDIVRYALPFGLFGQAAHWALVSRDVANIFTFRQKKIQQLFGCSEPHNGDPAVLSS